MVLGPRIDEEMGYCEILCNVRVVEGDYAGLYELDASYTFAEVDAKIVLDEIYPAMVEKVKQDFSEAEVRYYETALS